MASSVGVLFTVWMYRHGLITSVLTDQYQWIVTMTALVLIVAVAYWTGALAGYTVRGAPEPQDVQETPTETQAAPSVVCPNCGEVVRL